MRLLLPVAILAAGFGIARPDLVAGLPDAARQAASRLDGFAGLTGVGTDRRSTAARAAHVEPDRATALRALGRVAEAQADAQAADPADATARDRVNALLRSAAATMAGSEAIGELRALQEARARMADLRERAAAARIAGGDASTLEAQLSRAGAEVGGLTEAFTARLADLGVRISREAAENLAVSANGDDVLALLGAYANIERLEGELRASVAEARDNEAVLRRYYGVHATLLAVLETIQAEAVSRIDNLYLPRLAEVDRETRDLRADAGNRLRSLRDTGLRAALEANLRAQDLTLRATDLYRRYLGDQRRDVAGALERTRAARGVAENTARTAALALDVAGMVRNADRDFDAVMALRPSVIVPFADDVLRREFEGLSRRLGGAPTS